MKIGVFDSGIGGKSIAIRLQKDFPDQEVLYVNDSENVPYGSKTIDEVIRLTESAIQPLLSSRCDAILLACNTATAAAIEYLREKYPSVPFIGLEPMVKPAVLLSKTGIVAVCATPSTLGSERYNRLKNKYASNTTILEPDCSKWAYMIEHNVLEDQAIEAVINEVCDKGADVIVLACTHYHWIKERIIEVAGDRARVIDPSDATSRRVKDILHLS